MQPSEQNRSATVLSAPDMPLKKQGQYRFQDFEVDLAQRSLRREGHIVTISPRTFDLLVFLLLNSQRVIIKEELMRALWPDSRVEESNLSQHVFLLRKALTGSQSGDRLILTIPNRGYQFTPSVSLIPDSEPDSGPDFEHETDPDSEPGFEFGSGDRHAPRAVDSTTRISARDVDIKEETPDVLSKPHALGVFVSDFRHPGPWQVLALTAALVLFGFGGLFAWRQIHRAVPQSFGVVIADFENATGNPQFDLALKTALTIDLQQSPILTVASRVKVGQTLGQMKVPADKAITPELAREVCTRINDQAYLTGSIRRFARKYLVAVQAFDCAGGQSLARSKGLADSPDGIVAVLDKVAADIRSQLGEPAQSVSRFSKPLFAARSASLEALKAYSDASHLGLEGKPQDAVTLFQHAVELDPQFALAFADLGAVYSNLGERDLAKASLTRAYELRDTVDEPDRLFIIATYNDVVTGDVQASIRNDKEWSEEYPRNPVPLVNLASLLIDVGKPALAIDPAKRALDLNPDNSVSYEVLARAQLRLGQFDQAANTCQLAGSRHLDGEQIHGFLMQIAYLRLDQAEMDRQIEWAKSQPAEPFMMMQVGLMDFALGKARTAQAVFQGVVDGYRKQGQEDRANRIMSKVPRIEAELGMTESALSLLSRTPEVEGSVDLPVAWAQVGEASRAETQLKRELETHLTTTLWQEDFGPQVKAAIALSQQHPLDAIEDLKPAIPYDLRGFDGPAMRGRAYLAANQPELAEAEFHKILEHPGIEPLSHDYPLAQLGLARALAAQGKTVEAGFAYKVVLQIWKDADPDLPRLKEAKAEFARLSNEPPRGVPTTIARIPHKPSPTRR